MGAAIEVSHFPNTFWSWFVSEIVLCLSKSVALDCFGIMIALALFQMSGRRGELKSRSLARAEKRSARA